LLVMFLFLSLEYSLSCATLPLLIQCHTEEAYNWGKFGDVWDLDASRASVLFPDSDGFTSVMQEHNLVGEKHTLVFVLVSTSKYLLVMERHCR
jgi:hypothetical protein